MSWFGIPCIKSIYANSCLLVVWSKQKKNMWLGFFLLFGWESLLNKKKQSKEDIWPTTPQKVWQSFRAFHHNKWAVWTLGSQKLGGNLELPKPLRKAKGGSNGFSNPEPLELQNSNIFFQKALPRACKVRRGADTWYTIARPTATTSQQEPV